MINEVANLHVKIIFSFQLAYFFCKFDSIRILFYYNFKFKFKLWK